MSKRDENKLTAKEALEIVAGESCRHIPEHIPGNKYYDALSVLRRVVEENKELRGNLNDLTDASLKFIKRQEVLEAELARLKGESAPVGDEERTKILEWFNDLVAFVGQEPQDDDYVDGLRSLISAPPAPRPRVSRAEVGELEETLMKMAKMAYPHSPVMTKAALISWLREKGIVVEGE